MSERQTPRPAFIPFLIGDLLLLAVAGGIVYQSPWPLSPAMAALCVLAVACGAWLMVTPFILQYRASLKLAEADALQSTVAQIKNLEQIKQQIVEATNQWLNVQAECARTVEAARQIQETMAREAKDFAEFMQKANDAEKATLRVEVDKLKRLEGDWVQVMAYVFDHIYAVYTAGMRSNQPALAQQLSQFQAACRDAARRVGFVPFEAKPGEQFNPDVHQLADPKAPAPPAGTPVEWTLATGYSYQGRMLRPAVVIVGTQAHADAQENAAQAISEPAKTETAAGPDPVPDVARDDQVPAQTQPDASESASSTDSAERKAEASQASEPKDDIQPRLF